MAKTKQRIDWRGFAKRITNDDDLIYPDVQPDHPVMKELREIIFLNGLTDLEREAVRRYFEDSGATLPMETCYKIARGGKPNLTELEDMLFSGLMSDIDYEDFESMKESNPELSARAYYEDLCSFNEKDKSIKKLAKIFAAILDDPKTSEEHTNYISRQEFESMKHDIEWVKKNLKGLEKSKKIWPKV
jgi:hypothetical protein